MTARAGRPTPRYRLPGFLPLLVAARLILQSRLYQAGFRALTSD